MPTNDWKYVLDLSAFYHAEDLTLREKATRIVTLVENSRFFEAAWTFDLQDFVEEMGDFAREGTSVEIFDSLMENLYDYADAYRVWVKTTEGM